MTKPTSELSRATEIDKLQEKLQSLPEYELTSTVVIPLLKYIGYQDVTYHGGPNEQGKDVICWGVDELGDRYVAVAQVKRYKPSRKAKDMTSFSEIVTQLSQAVEQSIPHLDGLVYSPKVVYFITPYTVDTRTLQSRFEGFRAVRPAGRFSCG